MRIPLDLVKRGKQVISLYTWYVGGKQIFNWYRRLVIILQLQSCQLMKVSAFGNVSFLGALWGFPWPMMNGWELSWHGIPVSQYRCRRPMWLSVYSFLSLHHPMLIKMGKIYPISSICFSSFIADGFHWGVRPTNYEREEKIIPNANHTFLLIWAYRVCGNLSLCLHIWCLRWSDFLWICANIQNKTKTGVCF